MKEKVSIWAQLTAGQKVLATIIGLISSIGTLYGIFNVIHDKNEKIVNSITKQDVQNIVKGISDTNRIIFLKQIDLSKSMDGVVGGLKIMETNITTHFKADKSISPDERLDIIIKMIKQMDSTMSKANAIKSDISIKTERIWPTEKK